MISVGNSAFSCDGLTEINFNATTMNDLDYRNNVFCKAGQNGNGITVNIGANVKKIPTYLFNPTNNMSDAPKIKTIAFAKESLCTEIGRNAFSYCDKLESIIIPVSMTNISENVFYYCKRLTNIYYKGSETDWNNMRISSQGDTYFTNATRYYYSDENPIVEGNYWYYCEAGVPMSW